MGRAEQMQRLPPPRRRWTFTGGSSEAGIDILFVHPDWWASRVMWIPTEREQLALCINESVRTARHCDHCGAAGAIKLCSRCMRARYCGAECQRAKWKKHKACCLGPDGLPRS